MYVVGDLSLSKNQNFKVWDNELAAKAANWAAQNKNDHNPDRTLRM